MIKFIKREKRGKLRTGQVNGLAEDKNAHAGHRERMRGRMRAYGLETLQAHEVLEYLLYFIIIKRDVNPQARALIRRFGTLSDVLSAPIDELTAVSGIGRPTAEYLRTVGAIINGYDERHQAVRPVVSTAADAAQYANRLFFRPDRREMAVLCLNDRSELVASGLHEWAAMNSETARWLLQTTIESGAHHVVLVWKRSDKRPELTSRDDAGVERLLELLRSAEIYVKDIVLLYGGGKFASLRDGGALIDGYEAGEYANRRAKGLDEPASKR